MKIFIILPLFILAVGAFEYKSYEESKELTEYDYPKDEEETSKKLYDLSNAEELFKEYVIKYNKKYDDEESYTRHFGNFKKSLKDINELNSSQGGATSDINFLADLDEKELEAFLG